MITAEHRKVALDETITEWPWYRESVRVYWVTKFLKCPKSRKNKKMVLFFFFFQNKLLCSVCRLLYKLNTLYAKKNRIQLIKYRSETGFKMIC